MAEYDVSRSSQEAVCQLFLGGGQGRLHRGSDACVLLAVKDERKLAVCGEGMEGAHSRQRGGHLQRLGGMKQPGMLGELWTDSHAWSAE